MNYLVYVERSAENLQFFLWHRDYVRRWGQVPEPERLLAPEWTQAQEEEVLVQVQKDTAENMRRGQQATADMFRGTDFEKPALQESFSYANDDFTPPLTPGEKDQDSLYTGSNAGSNMSGATAYKTVANDAYVAAGAQPPCESLTR